MTGSNEPRRVHRMILAHEVPQRAHRCVHLPLGHYRLALCSRCVGLYPTLLISLALQLHWRVPPSPLDWWIALPGAIIGVLDWGMGRLGHSGSNAGRVATGSVLGVALSRSLALYFRDPWSGVFWVQALLVGIGVVSVELLRALWIARS